jgi:hypothetical protein
MMDRGNERTLAAFAEGGRMLWRGLAATGQAAIELVNRGIDALAEGRVGNPGTSEFMSAHAYGQGSDHTVVAHQQQLAHQPRPGVES